MALGWAQTPGLSAKSKGHCSADLCTEKVILPIYSWLSFPVCPLREQLLGWISGSLDTHP